MLKTEGASLCVKHHIRNGLLTVLREMPNSQERGSHINEIGGKISA